MLRSRFNIVNKANFNHQHHLTSTTAATSLACLLSSTTRLNSTKAAATPNTDADGKKKESGFLTEAKKEKLILGAIGATCSSMSVIGVCHLLVCQVPFSVAGGSVAGAALTGALGVFEGEGSGGAGFGTVIGVFLGGVGAWYAKTQDQPWSTGKGAGAGAKK